MKTTQTGLLAEKAVAEHLSSRGWKILEQNWRRKICEIDIIAMKDNVVYLVEVKYRGGNSQGDGLAYIGARKIKQLKLAANYWATENNWIGDLRLMAASVTADHQHLKILDTVEI